MSERDRVVDVMFGAVAMLAFIVVIYAVGGTSYKLGFDDGQKAAKGRGE